MKLLLLIIISFFPAEGDCSGTGYSGFILQQGRRGITEYAHVESVPVIVSRVVQLQKKKFHGFQHEFTVACKPGKQESCSSEKAESCLNAGIHLIVLKTHSP